MVLPEAFMQVVLCKFYVIVESGLCAGFRALVQHLNFRATIHIQVEENQTSYRFRASGKFMMFIMFQVLF